MRVITNLFLAMGDLSYADSPPVTTIAVAAQRRLHSTHHILGQLEALQRLGLITRIITNWCRLVFPTAYLRYYLLEFGI